MSEKIGIRPCIVLIEKGKVLCIKCKYDEEFYLFPGGGIEQGETIAEAAIREMEEETGLKVSLGKLIYVNDWIADKANNKRNVNMFFLGTRIGGEIIHGEKDDGTVKSVEWVALENFKNIDFRPKELALRLKKDYEKGFTDNPYFN